MESIGFILKFLTEKILPQLFNCSAKIKEDEQDGLLNQWFSPVLVHTPDPITRNFPLKA
jgi:hypothetical protein